MRYLYIFFVFAALSSEAQCVFDPTVTGDTLLCPNDSGMLMTQAYDSYQWYKRPISGTAQPIAGATGQTLGIDYANDAGYYFSVAATESGCTEISPEVLVDGYVFLLPFVQTTGNFTISPTGETVICIGDTVFFTLMLPYDTNITWFNNGVPIPGATSSQLAVTTAGSYTVQGAPSICPDFIQSLGVSLDVLVQNCGTGVESHDGQLAQVYADPQDGKLYVQNTERKGSYEIHIYNLDGRLALSSKIPESGTISVAHLPYGIYSYSLMRNGIVIRTERIAAGKL
jgi:hypothetical protein